jgi:aminoglycoside phosphotransferase (APT) family kinase protein
VSLEETKAEILRAMRADGLIAPGDMPTIEPLSGGVSCDVFRVALPQGPVCVKKALAKLRVQAEWLAPVERVHNEVAWLRFAAKVDPRRVPTILAEDRDAHLFVMNFFEPAQYPVWKALLLDGEVDVSFAATVGDATGAVHAASAGSKEAAQTFETGDLFHALRIEPYLLYTAKAHFDRAARIEAIANGIAQARIGLMHGDVSPKNILVGPDGPIFLDAETACYGDPAFDLAFCVNHLLLKCVWKPAKANAYCAAFTALKDAHLARVNWENKAAFDKRTAGILAALLLARVDGKSPVEYITKDTDMSFVRAAARDFLLQETFGLDDLLASWKTKLSTR